MNLEDQLSVLGDVSAPPTLRPSTLLAAGVADGYFPLDTPVGQLFVAYNAEGVSAVNYAPAASAFERHFRADFGRPAVPVSDPPAALVRTLREWLAGDRRHKLRFDLRQLTHFERAVLLKALEIPHGQVRPYGWIAREIGHPKAVRAVGTALAHNPIPLFIPCHRVIRSDGELGRYSLIADDAKAQVLEAEGVAVEPLLQLAKSGVRYVGSDTTHIFCFPTCRYNKRLTAQHQVRFPSEAAARASGYRPCKVCRPAAA